MTLNLVDPGDVVARPRLCRSCENNYSVYGCNFVKTVNIIDHKLGNWMIGMPGSESVSVAPARQCECEIIITTNTAAW